MNSQKSLLLLSLLLIVGACGKQIQDKSATTSSQKQEGRLSEYHVEFKTLSNGLVAPKNLGTITIMYDESLSLNRRMKLTMKTENLPEGVRHPQYIHEGTSCPTEENDTNRDGYIDYEEALPVHGAYVMGLDATPYEEELESDSIFPKGSNYFYWREMDVTRLASRPVINGKIVVIYGTTKGTLPETVAAKPGHSRESFFPIACGIITLGH